VVLERALALYPESRHLHALMADLLWYKSGGTDRSYLQQSAREATQAMDIGLGFGVVDYNLTNRLQQILGRTGDLITLDRLFAEALAKSGTSTVYLHYALGLSRLKDPRAEEMFTKLQRYALRQRLELRQRSLPSHGLGQFQRPSRRPREPGLRSLPPELEQQRRTLDGR
jgi:hypothetical protein